MPTFHSHRRRRSDFELALTDTKTWPGFDEQAIANPQKRKLFFARRSAITLYFKNASGKEIKSETGISIKETIRLRDRCLKLHPDGRIYGFRALRPDSRQKEYTRKAKVTLGPGAKYGGAGAFMQLLRSYPDIADLIERHVCKDKKKRKVFESRIQIKGLYARVIGKCKELGLEKRGEYPFNAKKRGYASLSRYVKKLIEAKPEQSIPANYGDNAAKKTKTGDGSERPVTRPFERVECDAHQIDAIFCILIPSIFGELIPYVVHRLWVIALKEVMSRAILGYHLSINWECKTDDVLEAIKHALTKWQPRNLTIPGLQYAEGAGFPSSYHDRFVGVCWDEFSVDGALAHESSRLENKLDDIVGAEPLFLKRNADDRPFIESFFRALEQRGFHRLPNTTGSHLHDSLRNKPELAACRFFIQIEHLEELTDVLIANYNADHHSSLGYRSPLEYLDFLTMNRDHELRRADLEDVQKLCTIHRTVRVRGGVEQGRRPFIHLDGANYTSDVLKRSFHLVGKYISIEANKDEGRTVMAYSPNGAEIGVLKAGPPWHRTPHSFAMRKAVNSLAARKLIRFSNTGDPIVAFLDYLEAIIQKGKPVPPIYLEARRLLANRIEELREDSEPPLSSSEPQRQPVFDDVGTAKPERPEARRPLPPPRRAING